MDLKTKVHAEEGKQDLIITREFELPVELIYRAHVEPELIEQWKGVKVVRFEGVKHSGYQAEVIGPAGNVIAKVHGVFHSLIPNKKIIRTFEVEGSPFGVSFEVYDFEKLTNDTSKLSMHIIYESVEKRNQVLKMPSDKSMESAFSKLEQLFKM